MMIPKAMEILKKQIVDKAHQLGFDLVGVTTPEQPQHFDKYLSWLENGYHANMDYLAEKSRVQKRANPKLILPTCRSILVLGARYTSSFPSFRDNIEGVSIPEGQEESPALQSAPQDASHGVPRGRVAAYAWGDDYHNVFTERMRKLVAFIEKQIGEPVPNRYYTDTGPILERELAQRAGLGWVGKNACLINPQGGSYYLLAEILLGIDLPKDKPFPHDRCGSCTRCIDACPTEAILPDRTVDSNRCISYLTIELKENIPVEMRHKIKDWVFGCDICQQVCPWNLQFVDAPQSDIFNPRSDVPFPTLLDEINLTPQAFNQKFKGNPIKRTKRRGYLRNVAVALGNAGSAEAVTTLSKTLQSEIEPMVRSHAAWALGEIEGKQAQNALKAALKTETNESVIEEIQTALSKLESQG